jgi:hypothetical protein
MTTRWLLTLLALATCACQHDVRLEFPEADAVGGMYECSATNGPEKCVPSSVVEPAAENKLGTEFVLLPRACQKHFHRIVIHDAGSSSPTVHVECAPPEGTLPPLTPITAPPATASASGAALRVPATAASH